MSGVAVLKDKGALLDTYLDSRSETEIMFLYGIKILYTVKSLILAQDER